MSITILKASSTNDFNHAAINTFLEITNKHRNNGIEIPNVTIAEGSTQTDIYARMRTSPQTLEQLAALRFIQLDEVYLDKDHLTAHAQAGVTPHYFKDLSETKLLNAVFDGDIPTDKWINFDPSIMLDRAVAQHRQTLHQHGGLHMAFLGIGGEGDDHYAQVSARTPFDTDVFAPELTAGMRQSYLSYIGQSDRALCPDHGLSLGPAAMPDDIIVTAKGAHKALPVRNMLYDEISTANPTTYLRTKPNLTVILDEAAASALPASEPVYSI